MFAIYLAAILVGSVSLVSSSRLAIQNGYWSLVAIYILVYLWAIIITFARRIPFPVRAWSGLTMFYVLGLAALLTGGPGGSGRLWLFALSIVACLLLGLRAGLITLALNSITIFVSGWLMSTGILVWPAITPSFKVWSVGGITFLLLSTVATVSVAALVGSLERGLRKEQKLATELETANEQLKQEIAERGKAERALMKSEQKLRALINLVSDSVYELDENLNYTYISPKTKSVSGYGPEDHVGKTPFDFMPPDETERLAEFVKGAYESRQELRSLENIAIHKDGRRIVLETSAIPLFDADGNFSGCLAIDRDITERKRAEELLRQSEERYRALFEESKDVVYVTTAEGEIVDINPAGVELFGYSSKEEFLKTHIPRDSYSNPDDRKAFQKAIAEKGFVKDYELNLLRKDGGRLTVLVTTDAVRDDMGNIVGYRGIMHDVTERRQLEDQLRRSSKLAAVGELAAGVAHEINNPIAVIEVQAGLIRDVLEDEGPGIDRAVNGQIEKCLCTVEEQVQRCETVTESLLSFARMPAIEHENFQINELLTKTVKLIMHLADRELKLKMNLDDRLPLFHGDANRLQQVFVNLLSNAVKAIDEEGSIIVATRLGDGGQIQIEFRDSGPGIAPEIKDRVFDPFFTTRSQGGGTGLGLSTSHYIIKDMNGKISVESNPGEGSVFTITLPADNKSKQIVGEIS